MTAIDPIVSNFVTFDIEEWYHANYADQSRFGEISSANLFANVESLLDLCDEHNIRSTCFILGCIARDKPEVVRLILDRGHEVASHGFNHELVDKLTPVRFREDVSKAKAILEDITGVVVRGYRAPSWSVTRQNMAWFYDTLAETGYSYSSSVYPGRTHLFGIPDFPSFPHYPNLGKKKASVLEIPQTMTTVCGKKIAFSGGFFLRLLPTEFIRRNIDRVNRKGLPVFIYLHPREIDLEAPRLNLSLVNRFIHYYNIANTRDKLSEVMSGYEFTLMKDYSVFDVARISNKKSGKVKSQAPDELEHSSYEAQVKAPKYPNFPQDYLIVNPTASNQKFKKYFPYSSQVSKFIAMVVKSTTDRLKRGRFSPNIDSSGLRLAAMTLKAASESDMTAKKKILLLDQAIYANILEQPVQYLACLLSEASYITFEN